MKQEVIKIDTVKKFNDIFGLETMHPMVSVINLSEATRWPETLTVNYGIYYMNSDTKPEGYGILFHPDFIHGTNLGKEIKKYSFFSYNSKEALHLSEEERKIIIECFGNIEKELKNKQDKHSNRIITTNIGLMLDYCLRFYDRQFETREKSNKNVIVQFEQLLDDYFESKAPVENGLPTVKYFAEKVFLSPNYFGDMISRQTGKTASEYIHGKVVDKAKEKLISTQMTMTEIAYELGFQYPQHLSRMFKKEVGCTPNEYRMQRV